MKLCSEVRALRTGHSRPGPRLLLLSQGRLGSLRSQGAQEGPREEERGAEDERTNRGHPANRLSCRRGEGNGVHKGGGDGERRNARGGQALPRAAPTPRLLQSSCHPHPPAPATPDHPAPGDGRWAGRNTAQHPPCQPAEPRQEELSL